MGRREIFEEKKIKTIIYIFSITLVFSIIFFVLIFIMYNRKLKENSRNNLLELGKLTDIVPNEDMEETSYSLDKTIENSEKKSNEDNNVKFSNTEKKIDNKKTQVNKTPVQAVVEESKKENPENAIEENNEIETNTNVVENAEVNETNNVEEKKELSFIAPVSGEIIKDFAMDTLVFSKTLDEWVVHSGIDIKANKTSIVVASEDGVVESIKNDPRYGLTIILNHNDGFKTIYSNLLTTEFVSEGKKVEKGETIATVGETASFEIADEAHLHFEMYKDGELVNPTIYLK